MKMNHSIKKMMTLCMIIVCILILLTGCGGKKTVRVPNADGTVTCIRFENHSFLTRAPVFTAHEKYVAMRFNGTEWYLAAVIGENERERIAEGELLAESTNIQVFRNKSTGEYDYVYVMQLEGTQNAFIAFQSKDAPDAPGYGTDFDYCISYYVNETQTVPDTNWEMMP